MCTHTTYSLEATYAYRYGFARKATYCIRVRLCAQSNLCVQGTALRVKRLILQGISWLRWRGDDSRWMLASRLRWPSMDYYNVLHVDMTFLIRCPEGSVRRMRPSVFYLRQSWLPIWPSSRPVLKVPPWSPFNVGASDLNLSRLLDDDYLLNLV